MEQHINNRSTGDFIGEESQIDIKAVFFLFLNNWKWFALSVLVCLFLGELKVLRTPSVYNQNMEVLLKREGEGSNSSLSELSGMSTVSRFGNLTYLDNQINILKAPIMMEEVARRLNLSERYSTKKYLRTIPLYKVSPVKVNIIEDNNSNSISYTIKILDKNRFEISDIVVSSGGELVESDKDTIVKFGDPLNIPYQKIKVDVTSNMNESYIGKKIYYSKIPVKNAARSLSGSLNVEAVGKRTDVIKISLHDCSILRIQDVLMTLVSVYNEDWIKDKNQVAISTSDFINSRLDVLEKELSEVDEDISDYKSKNLLPDVKAVASEVITQASENERREYELNNQLAMTQYVRTYISNSANKDQLLPANSGVNNSDIESKIEEYNTLLLKRNNLLSNSSERNPVIKSMTSDLLQMRNLIVKSMDDFVAVLDIQLANLNKTTTKTTDKIASSPSQAKYLISVERKQKVKESLYLFLLKKREENEVSKAFTAYNTKIVNPPYGGRAPISPRKKIILLIAFLIGLCIPSVIIYLRIVLDTTVSSKEDLKDLPMPFLGEISYKAEKNEKIRKKNILRKIIHVFKKKRQQTNEGQKALLVIDERSRNRINEEFRVLRTNIDFMLTKRNNGGYVLMSSSVNPDSGKTFLTVNMALSMAIKNSKVLCVDADLRKASLSRYIKSPKRGLSNYLCGENNVDLDSIIYKNMLHDNLDILPVGALPPNPSELLLSKKFESLILVLREKYDYIFIDCPPVDVVTDAAIVTKNVDMTYFVIRAEHLEKNDLPYVSSLYEEKKLKNMGIILNGIVLNSSRYGYGKYGYGKYGYGKYGYGRYGYRKKSYGEGYYSE